MIKKTYEDVPLILNSISYQMKRIADCLEAKNTPEQVLHTIQSKVIKRNKAQEQDSEVDNFNK